MKRGDDMYIPLGVKTDHSLLKSMVKIDNLITFLKQNNLPACGICDDNMFGVIEFYHKCKLNNIKPLIGLNITIENHPVYLYAQNYLGYQNLLKLNTLKQQQDLAIIDLEKYSRNIICIISYLDKQIYSNLAKVYEKVYLGYASEYEKNNALIITKNIVFFNIIKALKNTDTNYLKYLDMISKNTTIHTEEVTDYSKNYYLSEYNEEDEQSILDIVKLINVEIPYNGKYIPKYKDLNDSYKYLDTLTHKGLLKRLNGEFKEHYFKRLEYELSVIKQMGFVDYFLIVYDYILFAKKNDILVGPGRGSAAGSIVAYSLGITDIDPLKYDLLFERFLNKDRITMPDIDIDFEDIKRGQIISYLKDKYGSNNVANIMTYSSLTSKQVLRDVGKILEIDEVKLNNILKLIEAKNTLMENYKSNPLLQNTLKKDKTYQNLYKIALKLEGLKRQISTHAAGVVISSVTLDHLIPIVISNENILTGCTMEYLEDLGLIKMDILSIRNLRTIHDVLDLIAQNTGQKIKLNDIPLDDEKTLEMFKTGNTMGVFQFESEGMKSFLQKLKPSSFEEIIAAIALFRPGPMDNIDEFIKRKEGKKAIDYIHEDLKEILKSTYGIIIYQEQIMQILVKMGGYTFSEADNIRRAMSKKKVEIMQKEKEHFIKEASKRGYQNCASQVYNLILKFANYGFNKSHSVAYALVGYQMAYLKAHYSSIFYANLLNMSIASEIKTNEYLQVVKRAGMKIYGPNINESEEIYKVKGNNLLLPLGVIKNVGTAAVSEILVERKKGIYTDFFDFVKRCYGQSVTTKVLESLVYAGAFKDFNINKKTLINNIESAITYAELTAEIDSPLVLKPSMEEYPEFSEKELIDKEKEILGFYITNHPASRYHDKNIIKLENISTYFDKFIKCVVLVTRIYNVTTKKGERMYFVTGEDETASADFIIFPKQNSLMTKFKKDNLILVTGKVEKRLDKYQIVVSNIEKIN